MNDLYGKIHIASPCRARWEDMTGDERSRYCGLCKKHVYDLSILTAEAAAELIRAKEGKMCARFYQRADGTLLHAEDCPVGFASRQWRKIRQGIGAAVSVLLLFFGVNRLQAGEQTEKKPPGKQPADAPIRFGEVCVTPPPTPSPTPTPAPKKPEEKP